MIWAEKLWVFCLIGALYGFSYGGTLPSIILMNSNYFGVSSARTIFGVPFFGVATDGLIGAPIAGYIYDVTGGLFSQKE